MTYGSRIESLNRKWNKRELTKLRAEVERSNRVNNVLTLTEGANGSWTLSGPQDLMASVMRLAGLRRH